MIRLQPKPEREVLDEVTVKRADVTFVKYLPVCPKCSKIEDVSIFHVTKKIYECGKCRIRFHIV